MSTWILINPFDLSVLLNNILDGSGYYLIKFIFHRSVTYSTLPLKHFNFMFQVIRPFSDREEQLAQGWPMIGASADRRSLSRSQFDFIFGRNSPKPSLCRNHPTLFCIESDKFSNVFTETFRFHWNGKYWNDREKRRKEAQEVVKLLTSLQLESETWVGQGLNS